MDDSLFRRKDDMLDAAKRVMEHRDPMVHRGIGDAVKEARSPGAPMYISPLPVVQYFFDPNATGPVTEFGLQTDLIAAEAKKKARSDRMKATWAAQRAQPALDMLTQESERLSLYDLQAIDLTLP